MRLKKRICWLLVVLLLAFTACADGFDASAYAKGLLDSLYLGNHTAYMEQVDITAEEAQQAYEEGLQSEAEYFLAYWGICDSPAEISAATYERIVETYRQLYQHAKYTLKQAVKEGDGYTVELTVSPIDTMNAIDAEALEMAEGLTSTDFASDQALCDALVEIVLQLLAENMQNITYAPDQVLSIHVLLGEDGLYYISDDDMAAIDEAIIAY